MLWGVDMIIVLKILPKDFSMLAELELSNGEIINLGDAKYFFIKDNAENERFELYVKYYYYKEGLVESYKNKYQLAKQLSDITVNLNHARISYEYTKDFSTWLQTTRNY